MRRAFTLIELLVVIGIIITIAALIVVAISNARAQGRDAKRTANVDSIRGALEMYKDATGKYPASSIGTNPGEDGWVTSSTGSTCSDAKCVVITWANLQEKLSQYMVLPQDPSKNADFHYSYWASETNYKITAKMEENTGIMDNANDGGTDDSLYEVFTLGTQTASACSAPNVGAGAYLVISEVYYNVSSGMGPWIEIYNPPDGTSHDLVNWHLEDSAGQVNFTNFTLQPSNFAFIVPAGVIAQRWNYIMSQGGVNPIDVVLNLGNYYNFNAAQDYVRLYSDESGRPVLVDQVSWGGSTYNPDYPSNMPQGSSLERTDPNCDTDTIDDWRPQSAPNPGGQYTY